MTAITALRARLRKISKTPWVYTGPNLDVYGYPPTTIYTATLTPIGHMDTEADRDFVCQAPGDIAALLRVAEAAQAALNELGVPQPGYPAPVANAHKLLSDALAPLLNEDAP